MKKWDVKVQINWSANRVETLRIKANTQRKAEIIGLEASIRKFGGDSMRNKVLSATLVP
jgi:hypothetical protein